MTRAASVVLRVLGLALVLVGLMGFALLGVDGTWTARADVPAGRTAVLLEPTLASVRGPVVTVTVTPKRTGTTDQVDADAAPALFLGRGRSDDLAAYAQDRDVTRVVGLAGARRLDVQAGPSPASGPSGAAAAASDPSLTSTGQWRAPTTVDLWQQRVTGPEARALSWRPTQGAQSILIAEDDGEPLPALELEVAWTDLTWLWLPSVALATGLVMIAGGFALVGAIPTTHVRALLASITPSAAEPVTELAESTSTEPAGAADRAATRRAPGRRRKPTTWQRIAKVSRGRRGGEGR